MQGERVEHLVRFIDHQHVYIIQRAMNPVRQVVHGCLYQGFEFILIHWICNKVRVIGRNRRCRFLLRNTIE